MLKFIVKRILLMLLTLLGVLLFVFIISRCSGDPVPQLLGSDYTQEEYDAMVIKLGLDKPYVEQFVNYVKEVVTEFDLGTSYTSKKPVAEEVLARLPLSIKLAIISLAWAAPFGILCGAVSAVRQYTALDYSLTTISMVVASMPAFWAGMMLMLLFSLTLKWVPATGLYTWKGYILPCITMGLHPVASFCRTTRSSMLDVVRQDYVRTAKSKGLSENAIIFRHMLRNAAVPILSLLSTVIAISVGNAAVTENIFNIPGLGSYMIYSINQGDYPSVQGTVLAFSTLVCICNLVIDLIYAFVDPRIKSKYVGSSKPKKVRTRKTVQEGGI